MKIIFFAPYPENEVGSQRFRFEQYFGSLREEGISYTIRSFYPLWMYKILYRQKNLLTKITGTLSGVIFRFLNMIEALSFDFIFIHREITPLGPPVFEWIMARVFRKKIIYDFDDAIWFPNTTKENRRISLLKWHSKVKLICKWSYRVSCGNEYLADYARQYNNRVTLNPTTLDTALTASLYPDHKQSPVTIGWTGTHSTLPYLALVRDAIQRVIDRNPGTKFLIICNKEPDFRFPGLEFRNWNADSEIEDLRPVHIGLMPLPDTEWAKGKCGFKILQYFALGIPAIASPVGVNSRIIQERVNGFLCKDPGDWFEKLDLLVKDPVLRDKMGRSGKGLVETHYSLVSNRTNFLGLFL